jgi:hypothetical protein
MGSSDPRQPPGVTIWTDIEEDLVDLEVFSDRTSTIRKFFEDFSSMSPTPLNHMNSYGSFPGKSPAAESLQAGFPR